MAELLLICGVRLIRFLMLLVDHAHPRVGGVGVGGVEVGGVAGRAVETVNVELRHRDGREALCWQGRRSWMYWSGRWKNSWSLL